ncbi:MAG: hypothetical protein ACI8P9_003543 [Parasphingorhabdus sp.]|jgi:hypothetical protein
MAHEQFDRSGRYGFVKLIAISLLILFVLLWLSENYHRLDSKAQKFQTQQINKEYLDRGSLGKLFRELGLVRSDRQHPLQMDMDGFSSTLMLGIDVEQSTLMQIFWDSGEGNFNDARSHKLELNPGLSHYAIGLPALDSIIRLRLDFVDKPQQFVLTDLKITEPGFAPFSIDSKMFRSAITGSNGIRFAAALDDQLTIDALNEDPIVLITPSKWRRSKQLHDSLFEKRQNPSNTNYQVVSGGNRNYQSRELLEEIALPKGIPVISIYTPNASLHDPNSGLLNHRDKRGQMWERNADISWFENGQHHFSTSAGLRFHGGKSRTNYNSWRLYFGKSRGGSSSHPSQIFDNRVQLKTLVVHHTDWPVDMPLNNSLGFEVCKLLGCAVPESRLALFYLNGKRQGIVYLTEHQSWRQWAQRTDTSISRLFRFKSGNGAADSNAFSSMVRSFLRSPQSLTMAQVAQQIDIEQFSLHMLAHFYTANGDFCQGIAVLEKTPSQKIRWQFVAWDMDHGFSWFPNRSNPKNLPGWQEGGLEKAFTTYKSCPRRDLIQRLLKDDPTYRNYFAKLLANSLNFHLSEPILSVRVRHLVSELESGGYSQTKNLQTELLEFIQNRGAFLREEARVLLGLGEITTILNSGNIPFKLNGFDLHPGKSTQYFAGQRIILSTNNQGTWKINKQLITTDSVTLSLDSDISVQFLD